MPANEFSQYFQVHHKPNHNPRVVVRNSVGVLHVFCPSFREIFGISVHMIAAVTLMCR